MITVKFNIGLNDLYILYPSWFLIILTHAQHLPQPGRECQLHQLMAQLQLLRSARG